LPTFARFSPFLALGIRHCYSTLQPGQVQPTWEDNPQYCSRFTVHCDTTGGNQARTVVSRNATACTDFIYEIFYSHVPDLRTGKEK